MKPWIASRLFALSFTALLIGVPTQVRAQDDYEYIDEGNDSDTAEEAVVNVEQKLAPSTKQKAAAAQEEDAVEERTEKREEQRQEVQENTTAKVSRTLLAKPVAVTAAMAPQVVPQAQLAAQNSNMASTDQVPVSNTNVSNNGSSARARELPESTYINIPAPSTGVGGNNPGNANTGGVQVQHITVQASPTVQSDQNSELSNETTAGSNADILRRERIRKEVMNESRLIERLEEGRVLDEHFRSKDIEKYDASMSKRLGDAEAQAMLETVPVSAIGDNNKQNTIIQQNTGSIVGSPVIGTEVKDEKKDSSNDQAMFRLSPFGGYRWFGNQDSQVYRSESRGVFGITGAFAVNEFIGIEANFAWGRDAFKPQMGGYGYGYASPVAYGPGVPMYPTTPYGAAGYPGAYLPFKHRDTYEFGSNLRVGYNVGVFNPFAVAGLGFIYSNYNIDNAYTEAAATMAGYERSSNHVTANFGGGFDVGVARNMAVGARFDYRLTLNKKASYLNTFYGDSLDRYVAAGTLSVKF